MTAPVMTLPDGTTLREGDWARLRNGAVVGPLICKPDNPEYSNWSAGGKFWFDDGVWSHMVGRHDFDIISRVPRPIAETSQQPAPAVDYNDGEWHAWHGGDRPVHCLTKCETLWPDGVRKTSTKAGDLNWDRVFLVRVTSPYVEPAKPREWWIVGGCEAWNNESDAMNSLKAMRHHDIVHVREVTE